MDIHLTGSIRPHEGGYRAIVDGLGVHAYGSTLVEARNIGELMTTMKIEYWAAHGVLAARLEEFGVPFSRDEVVNRPARPATIPSVQMELTPA